MSLPTYKDLKSFKNIQLIDQEILRLQKVLILLRLKIHLLEISEAHLIAHNKRKIAQLCFKKKNILSANVDISN